MKGLLTAYIKDYRQYFVGIVLIGISLFILVEIIGPEWKTIQDKRAEIDQKSKDVANLSLTIQTINSANGQDIAEKLNTVKTALPTEKDIVAIYNAITSIAGKSSIIIKDFTLSVGHIYSQGKEVQPPNPKTPSLSVNISVASSDSRNVFTFSRELYKVLPLAEIKTVSLTSGSGAFQVNFYYKPYDPDIIAKQQNVKPLTPDETALLSNLESWKNGSQ